MQKYKVTYENGLRYREHIFASIAFNLDCQAPYLIGIPKDKTYHGIEIDASYTGLQSVGGTFINLSHVSDLEIEVFEDESED